MSNLRTVIAGLESKLANSFQDYKKEHPATKKTESDFHPAYGQTKPHLSHEEMMKVPPKEHQRLEKEHDAHSLDASRKAEGRWRSTGKEKEEKNAHHELAGKHHDMARMHGMYALSRTGKEDTRPGALQAAKKRHEELSKD